MKRLGIIRETKIPTDNRTPLTPAQCKELLAKYPELEICVQPSTLRVFNDEEYINAGAILSEDMSSCNWLFGVKEVNIDALIPNKHYFFFAHIGKEQPYNQKLCRAILDKGITLTDYEYLTKNGKRVVSFSFWAGVMGVYNALRLYGLRHKDYELPAPDAKFTVADILNLGRPIISKMKKHSRPHLQDNTEVGVRILITGTGRASAGAQFILRELGVKEVPLKYYHHDTSSEPIFSVAKTSDLVERKDGTPYDREDFRNNPDQYVSKFGDYDYCTTIFIPCHFWKPEQPKYLTKAKLEDTSIDVVGDVTCDIQGSVETTIRPSTHHSPFYGINVFTVEETACENTSDAIGVMAVDTLPNAIPVEASSAFGDMLMENVFPALMSADHDGLIERATLISSGSLTPNFAYLKDYSEWK